MFTPPTGPDYQFQYVDPENPIPIKPRGSILYLDLETYGGEYGDALTVQANKIRLITVMSDAKETWRRGNETVECDSVFIFDMLNATPEKWKKVLDYLHSYDTICGHNLAFDMPILIRHGMRYPKNLYDTIIASRVLYNGLARRHSLKVLVEDRLGWEMFKDLQTSDWSHPSLSFEQLKYVAMDVAVLPHLHKNLYERLQVFKLVPTYELECAILAPVTDMTLTGVDVDIEQWTGRAREAAEKLGEEDRAVISMLRRPEPLPLKKVRFTKKGEPYKCDVSYNEKVEKANEIRRWNLASPSQMLEALQGAEIPIHDTSYETLVQHVDAHPVVRHFLNWRDYEKQAGTFGEEWLHKNLHPDGKVYPNWFQLGAASGRFTCSGPNMQQVPRGRARKGIVAPVGEVFVRADYSQIEARVAAKISGDDVLLEIFKNNKDIHAYAAKAVLGKLEVTPNERQIGKSLVFGLLFSMSARSLRVYCHVNYGVKLTEAEAEIFRTRFFRTFTGLARWHDKRRKDCDIAKEFRTLLGRRRIVAHLAFRNDTRGREDHVNMLGLSLNTPVQGTAADMLKIAVRELWDRREEHPYAKWRMLVHDEIVLSCPEDKAEVVSEWLKNVMVEAGNVILDPVPCDASVKIGKTWGG